MEPARNDITHLFFLLLLFSFLFPSHLLFIVEFTCHAISSEIYTWHFDVAVVRISGNHNEELSKFRPHCWFSKPQAKMSRNSLYAKIIYLVFSLAVLGQDKTCARCPLLELYSVILLLTDNAK